MKVDKWLKNVRYKVEMAMMPPVCVLCGDPGIRTDDIGLDLCLPCQKDLPRLVTCCARCAEPIPTHLASEALCGQCQVKPPAYNRCLSMFQYQPPVDHLIQSLKFNQRLEMACILGTFMAQWLVQVIESRPDTLIPIPLHSARLRQRGFNQAAEIARPIAKELGCRLDISSCQRSKKTAPQSELTRKERVSNVRGAFEILKPVSGHIAIIDDVMTTGSTVSEFAKTLLNAGADCVDVWVCARA